MSRSEHDSPFIQRYWKRQLAARRLNFHVENWLESQLLDAKAALEMYENTHDPEDEGWDESANIERYQLIIAFIESIQAQNNKGQV